MTPRGGPGGSKTAPEGVQNRVWRVKNEGAKFEPFFDRFFDRKWCDFETLRTLIFMLPCRRQSIFAKIAICMTSMNSKQKKLPFRDRKWTQNRSKSAPGDLRRAKKCKARQRRAHGSRRARSGALPAPKNGRQDRAKIAPEPQGGAFSARVGGMLTASGGGGEASSLGERQEFSAGSSTPARCGGFTGFAGIPPTAVESQIDSREAQNRASEA